MPLVLPLAEMAGVDLVKEQIERFVGESPVAFEVSEERLSVWTGGRLAEPRVFDLTGEDNFPSPDGSRPILFRSLPLSREQWRRIWTSPDEHGCRRMEVADDHWPLLTPVL